MKRMKSPKIHKRRIKDLAKRMVAFTVVASMLLVTVPFGVLTPDSDEQAVSVVHAAGSPRVATEQFHDLDDFANYSIRYAANPDEYCEDTIILTLDKGMLNNLPSKYVPLGTEAAPFNGKILITQTFGQSYYFETDEPFFDYVTDSAVINYSDELHRTDPIMIEIRRKEKSAIVPLLANHVVEGGSDKATWKVRSALQTQDAGEGVINILVCNNSGLIGDIGENASVTIEYDNSAYDSGSGFYANIESTGDAGLICQTMHEGSRINLTLSGNNNNCLITSTDSGNAGGLVGRMEAGATLKIDSTYTPGTNTIITATSGFAGGIVGYNDGGQVIFPDNTDTEIRGSIVGTTGAGGLFGYYSNYNENDIVHSVTIDMANYDIDCTVKASTAGGLIGKLHGTADFIVDGTATGAHAIKVTGDSVTNFGGITGTYQTNSLLNKLEANNVTANTSATFSGADSENKAGYYGGMCGRIVGDQAAYVNVSSLTHNASSGFDVVKAFGGVIGDAGNAGSMLDVGTLTVATGAGANGEPFTGGGVVGILTDGVLRLSGTTDMQKAPASQGRDYGQLVGIRTNSLVYAVGSGNASDAGWIFNRSNINVQTDDIGTWGSVLRINGIETDVLTFDSTAHTVEVKAPVSSMESAADYTKTAINMQLNSGDKGALKFADSTNTKSVLLGTDLSFSGSIELSGTGNIGLMRDDYKDNINEIGAYTKKISSGTVNLAIGERYGSPSTGLGRGDIIAHRYNGLIARTDTGAEVNGITIDGTINVNATIDGTHVGGAVSDAKKGITLTNVTVQETINFNKISGGSHIVGGIVADVSGGNTTISGGTASPTIVPSGNINNIPIGGVIGNIANKDKKITASSLTVSANIDASDATATDGSNATYMSCVGFISDISGGTMDLTGVTVSGTTIVNKASTAKGHSGGFLGMKWLGTDVGFTANNGVIVSGTNSLSTTAQYAAGLVQQATGHWTVPEKGINITGMSIAGATNSLGVIVHDGYSGNDGLYLELTHKDSYYLGTGLTIPSATYYDELVRSNGSDILSNGGNGIISITTDGDLIMNGTNCNTYQNKYNQSNVSNSKSRYYYNLTGICAKAANTRSDGEKLLLWSLNKYAAENISSNFTNAFGTGALSGTFNLEHISYYPIDCPGDLTIGDATFIFYNEKIETSESASGDSDGSNRTTRGSSQHYLMHSGVFRNVSKAITTSGNVHFKGDIGVDSTYSGALISGTLSGSLTTNSSKEIVFEGLTLSDNTRYLLINNMTTNSKLTLSGIRTGGGKDFSNVDKTSETKYQAGATVASSLIGDVSGTGIQISFDRMKLDSRTTAGSPADLSSQYGTTKSIFSNATFLNKFAVDNNSTGTYNFEENLDWVSGTHNANVTYGKEIKTSVEYAEKQQKYFDQAHFVDPVSNPESNPTRIEVYPFDSGFLPYVRYSTATTTGENATRELKVNVFTEGLSEGCGTYNHPYGISSEAQLIGVATSINRTAYLSSLTLPKVNCNNDNNLDNLNSKIGTHWCEDKDECGVFTHNEGDGNYTLVENGTTYTWTEKQVSFYLASAYYVVKNDITINGTYPGLGASPSGDTKGEYAFRGVIVGASPDGSVKISMSVPKTYETSNYENTHGLITMSNGCVVKNLTIEVTPYPSDKYNYRVNGNLAYGYDEKFSNYGAVINKIMGGDNIIDKVKVNFTDSFKVYNSNDYKATVGGYVGCVVNGGLIFRNVYDNSLSNFTVKKVNSSGVVQDVSCNGNTITNLTDEKDLIHIHVNPFVGRVINGYAIRESDIYAFSEDGATYGDGTSRANAVRVTMHNTRKNYSIPDINPSNNNKLSFSQSTSGGSYDTISVPDSQALYIMSIIAQSGSGCASADDGNYANNISYCGDNTRNYSGSTKDNNKATHLASYSDIGALTKGDDYNLSKNDTLNNRKAIPYIIYKYTSSYNSNGTKYPARTLTKRTFYVNLTAGNTYYLPDSFRGIGFLGGNEIDDNMKIYGLNGNGTSDKQTVIDVNTEYFLNQRKDDPYWGPDSNNGNIGSEYNVGIGLFNNLKQSSSTGFNANYEKDREYQITHFILQGFLSAHHVDSKGEDQIARPQGARDQQSMNTAGLVPTVLANNTSLYNFSDISFKNLHIDSYAYAGGFVAYTGDNSVLMIYINNCNADGFRIEGSGRVAGFVGSYDTNSNTVSGIHINTGLDDSGNDSFTSRMNNTIINNKYDADTKHNYTAGILGSVWSKQNNNTLPNDNGDNARGHLILRNVTIEGGNAETNYIGNKSKPSGSSGGIIGGGSSKVNGCLIQNCVVKDIDIYGKYAGGIMGEDANRNSGSSNTGARIIGCSVTGKLDDDDNPQYTIMGLYYAGGVYGDTRDANTSIHPKYKSISNGDLDYVEYKTDIDGVYVKGYNIYSVNETNDNKPFNATNIKTCVTAGGIIGNNDSNRYIQNCKVEKCVIDVGTSSSDATNTPSGGLIGRINSGTIYGYNIEVKDCDFQTHQWSNGAAINSQKAYTTDTNTPVSGMKCGNVVGNGNGNTTKITAIHVENCPAEKDFESVHNDSFNVYADYNDVASTGDHGVSMSTLSVLQANYTNVKEGGLTDYFPHVNVSPVIKMGSDSVTENAGTEEETTVQKDVFLTGDGAALYSNNGKDTPVVDAIVNEELYTTSPSSTKEYIQRALESTSHTGEPNKISTYKTEMGSLPDGVDDFTVLVINSEARATSTEFINHYIQMVSNTSHDYMYGSNRTNKYTINVYPCTFDGSKYVINASGKQAGLEWSFANNMYTYYMRNTHADSNQGDAQFSLMDVQFYNPNTSLQEVAYHLYIPVLTKKMLMFEFYSASLSGTDNKDVNFKDFGNTLAESLDSWYTGYLQFTYSQAELQSILETGAGLNWNGAKTVLFKYQTNTVERKLKPDTQLVLCDPNNSDKYYYSKLGDMRPVNDADGEKDTISFSKFNSSADGTGDAFDPATLNDMLLAQGFKITATTAAAGTEGYIYAPTSNRSEADVIVSASEMYKKVDSNGTVKLTISYPKTDGSGENDDSKVLKENYYLAVRASGDSVYNYSIRTPATTSGGADKPTLRRSNVEDGNVTNIIMGSLYSQTVTLQEVLNNNTSSLEINGTDHRLDVKLQTIIQLTGQDSDKDYILNHLNNPSIHLYHSFIINLTAKYENGTNRSKIVGDPDVTTDFTISGNGKAMEERGVKHDVEEEDTAIQLKQHDIKGYLSKNGYTTINSSTYIDFSESWQYTQEFPDRSGMDPQIGVNVSAKSNLSYTEDKLLYTNMTRNPATPSNKYFYVKASDAATLVYNMKSEILDEYDKAGEPSFNYSQQGINPKNFIDEEQMLLPVKTTATYNVTNIRRSDFEDAEQIQFTLKLFKKTDTNDGVKYEEVSDIADYIDLVSNDSVFIKVGSGVTSAYASGAKMAKKEDNLLMYTADIDQTAFTAKENQRFVADIDFTVLTGSEFDKEFANYRFVLDVDLLNDKGEPLTPSSNARDWVVYTHAKINPDMLTLSEYSGN